MKPNTLGLVYFIEAIGPLVRNQALCFVVSPNGINSRVRAGQFFRGFFSVENKGRTNYPWQIVLSRQIQSVVRRVSGICLVVKYDVFEICTGGLNLDMESRWTRRWVRLSRSHFIFECAGGGGGSNSKICNLIKFTILEWISSSEEFLNEYVRYFYCITIFSKFPLISLCHVA